MTNTQMVTNLSASKLETMFNLCQAFSINVYQDGVLIFDVNMDEMLIKKVDAKYYETGIRSAFNKYVEMYNSIIKN